MKKIEKRAMGVFIMIVVLLGTVVFGNATAEHIREVEEFYEKNKVLIITVGLGALLVEAIVAVLVFVIPAIMIDKIRKNKKNPQNNHKKMMKKYGIAELLCIANLLFIIFRNNEYTIKDSFDGYNMSKAILSVSVVMLIVVIIVLKRKSKEE